MTSLLPIIISALCIKTTQIKTKEAKIACIEHFTNCLVDNPEQLDYCKEKEPKWIRKIQKK
jgi:hypothetical protein